MDYDLLKHKAKHNLQRLLTSIKWIIFSIIVGLIVGLCGTAFFIGLSFVTIVRGQNPELI